jgi:GNAT superfamily N-acetyltransferase
VLLYPRERNMWPAPNGSQPQARADARLGAPLDPWPGLQVKGRPLTAATIRAGPGYLEVPFVATHETKRGRGFGRCVVEAIEEVARALGITRLLLCSTCEEGVRNTWKHLVRGPGRWGWGLWLRGGGAAWAAQPALQSAAL